MKKILIYGDSNVWGDNFFSGERIPNDRQWSNILQKSLGESYKILQEGLPGRVAGNEEEKSFKNGKDSFIATFRTCAPVDVIFISLGTNDLQIKYRKTSYEIFDFLKWYTEILEKEFEDLENKKKFFVNKKFPEIIYLIPPKFYDFEKIIFDEDSEIERTKLESLFVESNLKFIKLNEIDLFEDGIHYNYEGHKKVASIVERYIVKNEL